MARKKLTEKERKSHEKMDERREYKKKGIDIKPSRRGSFRKITDAKKGKDIPISKIDKEIKVAKKTGNKSLEKKAVFAKNARSWKKK